MTLNRLSTLRSFLVSIKRKAFVRALGMNIHPTVQLSLSAKLDKTFPRGIHIDAYSYVASGAQVLTHDRTRGLYLHTRIGKDCFIGTNAIILPGITIGDNCVIGAGSVVTRDVPPRCIAAGNPARIIRTDIAVGHYGRFLDADDTERSLRESDPAAAALPDKNLGKG